MESTFCGRILFTFCLLMPSSVNNRNNQQNNEEYDDKRGESAHFWISPTIETREIKVTGPVLYYFEISGRIFKNQFHSMSSVAENNSIDND